MDSGVIESECAIAEAVDVHLLIDCSMLHTPVRFFSLTMDKLRLPCIALTSTLNNVPCTGTASGRYEHFQTLWNHVLTCSLIARLYPSPIYVH